eukprot:TRINITY_DN74289_c0_g1_i1.p1 TRINITY_DN74289_c0_g1~~TRINITY_DN74289_c0_g1_i1.p1  ORF type:complete len:1286 (+),score=315.88 TRINITY_DN74289_c0_g1_i1:252-4109(+)
MGGIASSTVEDLKDYNGLVPPHGMVPAAVLDEVTSASVLKRDYSTMVDLTIRLVNMPKCDTYMVVIYYKTFADWTELGRTELSSDCDLDILFSKIFQVKFSFDQYKLFRFEVYKVRDMVFVDALSYHKYAGCIDVSVGQLYYSRSEGTGWHVADIEHPTKGKSMQGKIAIWAEEALLSKQQVVFKLSAQGIASTDFWQMRPNPYCHFCRVVPGKPGGKMKVEPMFKTEVCRWSRNPAWKEVRFLVPALWPGDLSDEILIEVREFFRLHTDHYIGDCWIKYAQLNKAFSDSRPLKLPVYRKPRVRINKEKKQATLNGQAPPQQESTRTSTRETKVTSNSGSSGSDEKTSKTSSITENLDLFNRPVCQLMLSNIGRVRKYSFLDFLRGGMRLRLIMGLDFSRARGGITEAVVHAMGQRSEDAPNSFMQIMKAYAQLFNCYDPFDRYLVYGIGARVPPGKLINSDAFALTGDFFDPEVESVPGLFKAYRDALRITSRHGPTRLSPIVEMASRFARQHADAEKLNRGQTEMQFFVLVVMLANDVERADRSPTIEALAAAVNLPLRIVVASVGDKDDFEFIQHIQAELRAHLKMQVDYTERDSCDIVFHEHIDPTLTEEELVKAVGRSLNCIPGEVCELYAHIGAKPRKLKQLEDEGGNPAPMPQQVLGPGPKGKAKAKPQLQKTQKQKDREAALEKDAKAKKAAETAERNKKRLPPYILARRKAIEEETVKMGYGRRVVQRALRDGVPADDLDILIDCIVHNHGNSNQSYRELVSQGDTRNWRSAIAETVDKDLATLLLEESQEMLNADRVSLFVHDEQENTLKLYATNIPVTITVSVTQGIAGYVFRMQESLNIPDCYKDFRFDRFFDTKTGYRTRSMCAVPVISYRTGASVGVIQAINKIPLSLPSYVPKEEKIFHAVPFNHVDMSSVEELARQIGQTIDNGEMDNDAMFKALRGAKDLREVQSDISGLLPQESVTFLVERLCELLFCDRVSVFVFDMTTDTLLLYASNLHEPIRVPMGKGIAGKVFEDQDMVAIPDCYKDERFDPRHDKASGYITRSMVAVCIVGRNGESVGVIQAINKLPWFAERDDPNAYLAACEFNKDDEKIIDRMAKKIGDGVQEGLISIDKLTMYLKYAAKYRNTAGTMINPFSKTNFLGEENATVCRECKVEDGQITVMPCGCCYFCKTCCPLLGAACPICKKKKHRIIQVQAQQFLERQPEPELIGAITSPTWGSPQPPEEEPPEIPDIILTPPPGTFQLPKAMPRKSAMGFKRASVRQLATSMHLDLE